MFVNWNEPLTSSLLRGVQIHKRLQGSKPSLSCGALLPFSLRGCDSRSTVHPSSFHVSLQTPPTSSRGLEQGHPRVALVAAASRAKGQRTHLETAVEDNRVERVSHGSYKIKHETSITPACSWPLLRRWPHWTSISSASS
jgi:hypothetical protein